MFETESREKREKRKEKEEKETEGERREGKRELRERGSITASNLQLFSTAGPPISDLRLRSVFSNTVGVSTVRDRLLFIEKVCKPKREKVKIVDVFKTSRITVVYRHLRKLTHVWKDNLPRTQGFQNLTSLIISGCGNLRNIFSPSQARLLVKLQKIRVAECSVLEAIVGEEPKMDDKVAANIIMFPQLSSLELYHLPNVRSICSQAYTVEGSFLKKIEVINCPNMKALPSAFQGIPELQESNVQKVDFFGSAQHHLWDGNL
ncbi:hypothetical protein HYC85_025224 [Camellia sinensis]|uniref:Disease resistance protein At4g27190-like leucine-rich repeats domain-containing protein n=1 Tax=Camellia sinensis TaxID=4442 RepID=A0A7J7GE54_CAMSI|nr:hypothetical protein HYC85_025224 [Camellia sinensis]